MAKRKYTQAERERLGIRSAKAKRRSDEFGRKSYRTEHYDWDDDRDRRRSYNEEDDRQDDGFGWFAAAIVAAVIVFGILTIGGM